MKLEVNGQVIEESKNEKVFEIIENSTGLDKPMALAILKMGNPVKHPKFEVRMLKERP